MESNGTRIEPQYPTLTSYSLQTRAIHTDDHLAQTIDVAPPIHVSTTFNYPHNAELLVPTPDKDLLGPDGATPPDSHVYSRLSAPNTTRLEAGLSSLLNGRALTYASGLSAFHALLIHLNPKRIAIGDGYHGCHGVIKIMSKLTGLQKVDLHGSDADWDAAGLGKGDVVHVETPLNPTGEAYNLEEYVERAHKRGAWVTVDATFGPPGLQDPFAFGVDAIFHSGTKYIGGHSDMLCGVVAVQRKDWWASMFIERLHLGSVMGSLEGWLGLRSLRTLELRIMRQSKNADELVRWIHSALKNSQREDGKEVASASEPYEDPLTQAVLRSGIADIKHASLQAPTSPWLKKQMPNGFGPVFAIYMKDQETAKKFAAGLQLFHHATSLGGVESLVEWRFMSDPDVDVRLVRVSVGVEDVKDLKADITQALRGIVGVVDGKGGGQ